MDKSERQAAKDAFKKQKVEAGIFLITCVPTGRKWVGKTRNLGAVRNRLIFSLKVDPNISSGLRSDWEVHGDDSLTLHTLETLSETLPSALVMSTLREKMDYWRTAEGAEAY